MSYGYPNYPQPNQINQVNGQNQQNLEKTPQKPQLPLQVRSGHYMGVLSLPLIQACYTRRVTFAECETRLQENKKVECGSLKCSEILSTERKLEIMNR